MPRKSQIRVGFRLHIWGLHTHDVPRISSWRDDPNIDTSMLFGLELMETEGRSGAPPVIPILPNRRHVKSRDVREFVIDDPQSLIDKVEAGGVDLVVGRAHDEVGSFFASTPAPAAGWIPHKGGLIRNGKYGLNARVEWTDIGRASVESREFRYVSPVIETPGMFEFLYEDGEVPVVDAIVAASLVNVPALNMPSLNSRASVPRKRVNTMNEEQLAQLREALGLPIDAKPDTIVAAAQGREPSADLRTTLAALSTLTAGFSALSSEVRELRAQSELREMGSLPAEVRELAARGLKAGGETAELTRSLIEKAASGFSALTREDPTPRDATPDTFGLSDDDLAFCAETGIDPKDFAAAKPGLKVV